MRLIFQPGATATKQREDYEKAQLLVQDVLCELPASSVEVCGRLNFNSFNMFLVCFVLLRSGRIQTVHM